MARKRKIDLKVSFVETTAEVDLRVELDGKPIAHFNDDEPPAVRVNGFYQPSLSKEQLIEVANREAYGFPEGAVGVLRKIMHDREKDLREHAVHLRKLSRKIVMSSRSCHAARAALEEVAQAEQAAQRDVL